MADKDIKGFPVAFNIYAHDENEIEDMRRAIVGFINEHAAKGRAVTAGKVAKAIRQWDNNPIVKRKITEYFT